MWIAKLIDMIRYLKLCYDCYHTAQKTGGVMETSLENIKHKIEHHRKMIKYHQTLADDWERLIEAINRLEATEVSVCECMDENKTTS
jgi:hypothetical protein